MSTTTHSTTNPTNPQPAIVIVHGSWHVPAHYSALLSALTSAGFKAICPLLTTSSNTLPPIHSLDSDTSLIRSTLTTLADSGHPIILMMHSYGGVVGTNSLVNLSFTYRRSHSLPGGVVHLIYLAAFILPLHTNILTPYGNEIPPFITEESGGTIVFKDPRNACYNDLSDEEAAKYLDMMVACPRSILFDKVSYVPYGEECEDGEQGGRVPAMYIIAERDTELKKEVQEMMAKGLLGENVEIERVDAGHCAFIRKPDEIKDMVVRVWEGVRKDLGI